MKLGLRILVGFLLIFVGAFYFLTSGFLSDIRYRYLEGVEDVLVDQARILAAAVSADMEAGRFAPEHMRQIFDKAYTSRFSAKIYQVTKTGVDLRIYLTDHRGIVIFDSVHPSETGADYSNWRDVHLTLRGEYGARSTDADPDNPASTILYVAAPVMVHGRIAGVLTVAKPTTGINSFLEIAKAKALRKSLLAGVLVVLLSTVLILIIVRPINALRRYADDVRLGKPAVLPSLDSSEIGDMGRAFERMRETLEGKKTVEHYIQTLTHEIKSPISAIQGAAELLEENMPAAQRNQFLSNIRKESDRIRQLSDRMLHLSSLESLDGLEARETIDAQRLLEQVMQRHQPAMEQKRLVVTVDGDEAAHLSGDPFLIGQAVTNLIQNAIDFSPEGGHIAVRLETRASQVIFVVEDQGPGIPEFARERIFERFFSIRRPATGEKSTGLGLNFVRKIAELHTGTIRLESREPHGARAVLSLPIAHR